MSITFSDLVKIYREFEPIDGSDKRAYCPKTEEQLDLLNQLLSDENYANTALEAEK